MTITITVNVTGAPDTEDRRAMTNQIRAANAGRVNPLPFGTGPERKASYETLLKELTAGYHASAIQISSEPGALETAGFTDEQRRAIRAKQLELVNGGKTTEQVTAAILALT